jgi:hypothetical protein
MPEAVSVRNAVAFAEGAMDAYPAVPGKARQAIGMSLLMTDFVFYCRQQEQEKTLATQIKQILAGKHTHKRFNKAFLHFDT